MTRKLIATIITALLMLALVPSVAFASATGTAELTKGLEHFPGSRSFTLKVNNAESPLVGKTINYVRVILPVDEAGVVNNDAPLSAPAGWTAERSGTGSLQRIVFRSSSGIPTAASQDFTFPANVMRPASTDMFGDFEVTVSSDGGKSTKAAPARQPGLLTTAVRILELSALAPSAPAGVTDRSATAGQTVTYTHQVRNHALNAISVTSSLSSDNLTDVAGAGSTVSVPGNPDASTPVSLNMTFGPAPAGDRQSIVTAAASATGATAKSIWDKINVQVPAAVDFTELSPRRVRSGTGALYTFKVKSSKTGTPALTVTGGSMSFATTTATLDGTPLTYNGGANAKDLSFKEVTVTGGDGTYTPAITLTGVDANDFGFSQTKSVLDLIIDNLAPVITVTSTLPSGQTAAKNGDSIKVAGSISQAADDLDLKSLKVSLVSDTGNSTPVTVTTSKNSDGTTSFEGSAKPSNFSATDKSFVAKVEVADTAGNIGAGQSLSLPIDLVIPTLINPGQTDSSDAIRVTFVDNVSGSVTGGCDAGAYLIDGVAGRVSEVRFDGQATPCAKNSAPADGSGTRILVLRTPLDRDDTPRVTYNGSANLDPARDGAFNNAALQTIETVSGIVPPAPIITTVTRNGGSETAVSTTDANGKKTYFTRFAGTGNNDTEDLQVSFSNARSGYTVQVLDGSGKVLSSKELASPTSTVVKEFTASVRIPIGTTDTTYARSIRLIGNNLAGAPTPFDVVLDRVVPSIASSTKNGNDVTVKFNEVIASGTDFANDWYAWESTATGRRYYGAENVALTDPTTRTITFAFQNKGTFGGVDYQMTSPDGKRYEDRAGNVIADTIK